MADPLEVLTRINLDDLVGAFGWQDQPFLRRPAATLFHGIARSFALQMLAFDGDVGRLGLAAAARRMESRLASDVRVFGAENVPAGSFLALANHPGLTDTLAIFAALSRDDLRIIALQRPFLEALPNVSRHLLFLPDTASDRMLMVREAARHLRGGGCLLTFPAGHTEPDPAVYPGAQASLSTWLESSGVFLRLAPGAVAVPICVRDVSWSWAARHPITRLRRTTLDRQLLGAAVQLVCQLLFRVRPVAVNVQIGPPIAPTDPPTLDVPAIHRTVLASMQTLLSVAPQGASISALEPNARR